MNSFTQLLLANIRILYRDRNGFIWNLLIPVIVYSIVAALTNRIHVAQFNYGNFLLPGIVAYVIMQGGIYSLAYWLVDLKSQGVIKRFLVTPIKVEELIASVVISRVLVLLLQVALLSAIGSLIFHTPFAGNVGTIALLTIFGGGIFLLLGLLISAIARSYQAASPLAAAIGLPFAALGDIFIPLNVFPKSLQTIGHVLPITYLSDGLRQAYLYPFNFEILSKDIILLFVWFMIILIITLSVFRLHKE